MNIIEALKETGMARWGRDTGAYIKPVFRNGAEYLVWHDSETDIEQGDLSWQAHFDETYIPYHKEPEIKPKEDNEVWFDEDNNQVYGTFFNGKGISFRRIMDGSTSVPIVNIIHGQNGWIRIRPEAQEDILREVKMISNNTLYFNDSSDYEGALWKILELVYPETYDEAGEPQLKFIED